MPEVGDTKLKAMGTFRRNINNTVGRGSLANEVLSSDNLVVVNRDYTYSRTLQYKRGTSYCSWQITSPLLRVVSLRGNVALLSSELESDEQVRRRWFYFSADGESTSTKVLDEVEAEMAAEVADNPEYRSKLGQLSVLSVAEIVTGPPIY
ncbi:MAG TPA: hypothetical protein VMR95_00900, partial [Candidatus Binatia bacterium]|nr:hypothetical protein [Candidatus Binatia bacterium]